MALASNASKDVRAMKTMDISAISTLTHSLESLEQADNHLLVLGNILQATLEPQTILELFAREASAILPIRSLSFSSPHYHMAYDFGVKTRHSCQYTMELKGEPLGTITLTKDKRFSKAELSLLENLLCILIYPLRNAFLYRQALQEAKKDALTGLNNRAALDETLLREVKLAQRHDDKTLSLIVLDIDHFKNINDTHGHATGDCLIRACADIIQTSIRSIDFAFRPYTSGVAQPGCSGNAIVPLWRRRICHRTQRYQPQRRQKGCREDTQDSRH